MMVSWRQKFLLFTLLAFIVLASDASRLPGAYWEQMLPKKLPTPSSSPSKGTNSVSRSYSTTIKSDSDLSSTDGKFGMHLTVIRGDFSHRRHRVRD
ncbi:hypothetical protein OIU84_005613 [Salix udensis]|uniref:Uncharacterized protein n=1 Tax=Salix udensis TaxID=889485 RepID=A0AAD6JWK9_9ROSI|nr:hypothetical protein OIU84_005613 [Salix udensis]